MSEDTNKIIEGIEDSLESLYRGTTANWDQSRQELRAFLDEIAPNFEAALSMAAFGEKTHANTLRFMRDSITLRATRLAEGFIHSERQMIAQTAIAVLRGAIGFVGAVA